jgi:glycosyltransferase involved in cell wall biosynthesis
MISGHDFIVIADEWDGLPTCTSHLCRQISRHNRVFWLTTVNRMPRVRWQDARKVVRMLARWRIRRPDLGASEGDSDASAVDGLHVVTPIMVPWFKPWGRLFNHRSLLWTYRRIVSQYGIVDPIIVTMFPSAVDFMMAVDSPLKLYYCVDEWLELPGLHRRDWAAMESELLDRVDALVVTSRELEKKNREGCPLLYLPHGVEFDHFDAATQQRKPIPVMERLQRPIVGFFGLVGQWVDMQLITTLAEAFPQVSFVFIGGTNAGVSQTAIARNVLWLGSIPYVELPHYARYFDVGLIPFLRSKLTEAVNPLKLMEYYALGLPVLATRLPELENAPGPVELASNAREFCDRLGAILSHEGDHYRHHALEVARRNTWQDRAEQFTAFAESLLPEGQRSPSGGVAISCLPPDSAS